MNGGVTEYSWWLKKKGGLWMLEKNCERLRAVWGGTHFHEFTCLFQIVRPERFQSAGE